ncbi:MAG: hypothetical protein AAF587_15730 [Bacteroidota bacterium]
MDLDEMKLLWDDLSEQRDQQQRLTDTMIVDMTKRTYHSKLRSIAFFETIGAIFCFGLAAVLIWNWYKLDTWYLIGSGLFSMLILTVMPILSLNTIYQMQGIRLAESPFRQTVDRYTRLKKRFFLIQQLMIGMSFIFAVVAIPLAGKIMSGKDIFLNHRTLIFAFVGCVGLFFFVRWGYRKYVNMADSAEEILRELQQE